MKRTMLLLFIFLFATPISGWVSLAEAQQAGKVYRVGYLGTGSGTGISPRRAELRQALRDLGYVEGQNLLIEWRFARKERRPLSALADELIRLKVDVLFTSSFRSARAAKKATRTIPIVFLSARDPVAAGLVDSLARPGGNLTGLTHSSVVLTGKRLELLKEIVPKLSRVAVLWQPGNPGSEATWKESQLLAQELGLQLHSMAVSSADEFEGAFQKATKANSDALAVAPGAMINRSRRQIVKLAIKNRLPGIYTDSRFVHIGGLVSYAVDRIAQFRRAATYVDRILTGAKPSDLPVWQPTKFDLIINLKTANQLGITIPYSVLFQADKVIK